MANEFKKSNLLEDSVLVSELVYKKQQLTPKEIMKALVDGHKIKLIKAIHGVNFYLDGDELKSDKISYVKGIPITWFNKDIKYEIDYD